MAYNHGIVTNEQATSIVSAVNVDSATAVVFGTAPINMGDMENVNKPVLCYSYKEAVAAFGFVDDFSAGYTLPEVIYSQFTLYGVSPTIFVNVLDPAKHKKEEPGKAYTFADNKIELPHTGIIKNSVKVNIEDTDMTSGIDYDMSFLPNGRILIQRVEGGLIPANVAVQISYTRLDPTLVTADEVIGGIDINTGAKTGIELIEEIFPRFRIAPAILAAPGFSQDNAVAAIMAAKADRINGLFKAIAIADIQDASVKKYSDVPNWKNEKSLTSEDLITAWPKVTLGGKEYWLSTHLLGVIAKTDANNDSTPYKSPSNESMNIDGLINNGASVIMTPDEGAYLNGNGVVTALNFIGGFKAWGNRTAAYPGVTDVKDCMIPVRRMFAWANNTIILTYWQKVDYPIRKRTIDNITDSVTFWLNGLTAREIILGGRIVFDEAENPVTDIMDGIIRFHLYLTPPTPAREIDFTLEYDPAYLETLFS